ncbi:hypothetical protein HYC85_002390 [Camellia sinensis]|uniref:Uncharacterized protein n=1 Tax=Camellia sinensis TaxID=4442 RepID=A0A7J7I9D5_CAMSI|nr:hypothetical protein HYC85_002390 [Camellia sinensis]
MSMHAKTDSEVTSLAPSSPTRSPRRPVYYVQSPSRDSSHDGEKTTNSFHSTPIISPMGSPGRHSRDSSSTRFSGSLKPGAPASSQQSQRRWLRRPATTARAAPISSGIKGLMRLKRRVFSMMMMPIGSISFNNFVIQAGNDFSGVATEMATTNSTGQVHLSQHRYLFRCPCKINTRRSLLFSAHLSHWKYQQVLPIKKEPENDNGDTSGQSVYQCMEAVQI